MSFYSHHVFFCTNQREAGRDCCNNHGASDLLDYAKDRIRELGLKGEGKVRVQKAGCLDRCDLGPVLVIYPEETGIPSSTARTSMKSFPNISSTAAWSND